jgi:hypothetical protein
MPRFPSRDDSKTDLRNGGETEEKRQSAALYHSPFHLPAWHLVVLRTNYCFESIRGFENLSLPSLGRGKKQIVENSPPMWFCTIEVRLIRKR